MSHVRMTCLNHPDLRWSCKAIAVTADGRYNGLRNIFFLGTKAQADRDIEQIEDWAKNAKPGTPLLIALNEKAQECACCASLLRVVPEEAEKAA